MIEKQMKRVVYNRFGGPEVLEIEETSVPKVKKGEVLLRMLATSVNGGDLPLRQGKMGLVSKLTRFPQTLGIDVVGIVEKVGQDVTDFKVGDRVWGNAGPKSNATAEYITISANYVSKMPEQMDVESAAAIPTIALTAYTALVDKGNLKAGDRVLIRGTGGVGLMAVQIAKALGAHVTTLSSGGTLEQVKELGADQVYDYRETSSKDLGKFDLIFDTAGKGQDAFRSNLKDDGRLVTASVESIFRALSSIRYGSKRTRMVFAFANHEKLDKIKQLVESGQIRVLIDSVYPMNQIVEAHGRAETKGLFGKVVVSIAKS